MMKKSSVPRSLYIDFEWIDIEQYSNKLQTVCIRIHLFQINVDRNNFLSEY